MSIKKSFDLLRHLEMCIGTICDTGYVIREGDEKVLFDTINKIKKELSGNEANAVKRGTWIYLSDNKCKCSYCETVSFIAVYPNSADKNYCPNCGAEMR